MAQQYHVGIDLGTTFSSLAYVDESGHVEALRFPDGSFQMASAIYFKSPTEIIVGNEALQFAVVDAGRVARAFKRQMGNEEYVQIGLANEWTPFEPDGKRYRPEELSAMVLRKLLQLAEEKLGHIERAVISVPFVFDEKRRQATRDAGIIAGLKDVDFVDEPVAAAIAYGHMLVQQGGYDKMEDVYFDERVLVFDLGGGTFDATIMKLKHDGTFEVEATSGDERLGGEDWDREILEIIVERYEKLTRHNPRDSKELMQELRLKAVAAKETLSSARQVEVVFSHDGTEHTIIITRPDFDKKTQHLVARTEATLAEMLESKEWTWSNIDRPLLVGGSSRMPMIFRMMERGLGPDRSVDRSLPADTAIAMGAAIFSAHRKGQSGLPLTNVITVNSHALGLMIKSAKTGRIANDVLIPVNQPTETRVTRMYGAQEGMKALVLMILQGDSKNPNDCVPLGKNAFRNLPTDLTANDRIEVTFYYQKNGMLKVEGVVHRENGSSHKLDFQIKLEGEMSKEQVEDARTTTEGFTID